MTRCSGEDCPDGRPRPSLLGEHLPEQRRLGTVVPVTDEELDALWNRACEWDAPAIRTHRGDEALHVVLTFDGSVNNGGLLDAVETYGEDREYPLSRVLQAYRFLGLEDAASIITRARQEFEDFSAMADDVRGDVRGDVAEERINASYVLETGALRAAVRATVQASPQSFAPPD